MESSNSDYPKKPESSFAGKLRRGMALLFFALSIWACSPLPTESAKTELVEKQVQIYQQSPEIYQADISRVKEKFPDAWEHAVKIEILPHSQISEDIKQGTGLELFTEDGISVVLTAKHIIDDMISDPTLDLKITQPQLDDAGFNRTLSQDSVFPSSKIFEIITHPTQDLAAIIFTSSWTDNYSASMPDDNVTFASMPATESNETLGGLGWPTYANSLEVFPYYGEATFTGTDHLKSENLNTDVGTSGMWLFNTDNQAIVMVVGGGSYSDYTTTEIIPGSAVADIFPQIETAVFQVRQTAGNLNP